MIAVDPVCKMEVETESAQWTSKHEDKTYYFCAPGCMHSFEKDPKKYLETDQESHSHDHDDHHHHH